MHINLFLSNIFYILFILYDMKWIGGQFCNASAVLLVSYCKEETGNNCSRGMQLTESNFNLCLTHLKSL